MDIREIVDGIPFVDTHEHLLEETTRLRGEAGTRILPCDDWAYLFYSYVGSDLRSAGMTAEDWDRLFAPGEKRETKIRLLRPWWDSVRGTGYGLALRHTLRDLYGVEELDDEGVQGLDEGYRARVRPGFYREILRDLCNIEHCHVNSSERIFMTTAQPDLLRQDLSIVALGSGGPDLDAVERDCGERARDLEGWKAIIDGYFARFAHQAVAVKSQSAYARRLDYADVPSGTAAPLFSRLASGATLDPEERKRLEDHLFRYCLNKATEHGLPVKLHTGYYSGTGYMPLDRVRRNASDLCLLLEAFPETRFVLMHAGYPYQDEFIALAKHYPNVWVDLCWAWIINPTASVRFLKETLTCAPRNKVLGFGGDYFCVENVYGHARVARQGIARALEELQGEGWIEPEEVPVVAEKVMRSNALALFPDHAPGLPRPQGIDMDEGA